MIEDTDRHPETNNHRYKQKPPALCYADPQPVYARAGQATVLCGTLVHCGSVTPGRRERRMLDVEYRAKEAEFPFYVQLQEQRERYLELLKEHFPENKLHLLPGMTSYASRP